VRPSDGYTLSKSFTYTDRDVGNVDPYDLEMQPDLNMLIAPWFAFLYNRTGIITYRDYALDMFEGAFPEYDGTTYVSGAYLGTRSAVNPSGKQYDQQMFWAADFFAYMEAEVVILLHGILLLIQILQVSSLKVLLLQENRSGIRDYIL